MGTVNMYSFIVLSFIGLAAAQCPANLLPCNCQASGPDLSNATLDCSAITDVQQFATITELRTTAGPPIKFATIVISGNQQLTSVPANAFGRAHADEYVFIDNINLDTVESGFMNPMADPVLINFSRNKIAKFPFQDLKGLSKLEYLVLQYNEIPELPARAFQGVAPNTLKDILLNNNKISVIGHGAFAGPRHAANAYVLSFNELSDLTSGSLCLDSSPEVLVLESNQITTIAPDTFTCGTGSAKRTILSNNQLSYIEEAAFKGFLTQLQSQTTGPASVDVTGNPLKCENCAMYWLRQGNFENVLTGAVCTEPVPLAQGKTVFALPESYFTPLKCRTYIIVG